MKNTIGIALSATQCHVVKLRWQSGSAVCKKNEVFDCAIESIDQLQKQIVSIRNEIDSKTQCVVGIPDEKAVMRDIKIDRALSDAEIMCFLQSQAHTLFGYPAAELCIDYQRPMQTTEHIIAIAAQRDWILSIDQLFTQHHVKLAAIDINTFALQRFNQYTTALSALSLPDAFSTALGLCVWSQSCV